MFRSAPLTALLAASTGCFAQQPADETASQLHTLPALTVIDLIVEEAVSSDVQKNGDRFPLRVAEDVLVGDVVVIPAGVLHGWVEIPEQVRYLSIRPDPDRVLPAGYVNPAIKR